jgi:hypothetical protein
MPEYATITSESVLQDVGPYLLTSTKQATGDWQKGFTWHYLTINGYTYATMLASEQLLAKDWDTPEEDAAWADL